MKKWKDLNNIQKAGVTAVGAAVIGGITYAASKYIPPFIERKLQEYVTTAMKGNVLDTMEVGRIFGKIELSSSINKSIMYLKSVGFTDYKIAKVIVSEGVEAIINLAKRYKEFSGGI